MIRPVDDRPRSSTRQVETAPGTREPQRILRFPEARVDGAKCREASADEVSFGVATGRRELHSAMRLVHDAYVRLGLIEPNGFGLHVTPYQTLASTEVLVARRGLETIATVSILEDGEYGLPMDAIYREEVDEFRRRGVHVAEVGSLADTHDTDDQSPSSLFRLMALVAQRARHHGIDVLLITVHPRHAKFYERFLGFEVIGEQKSYEMVSGAPAVPLALDLVGLREHSPRAYKRLFGKPFPEEELEREVVPRHVRAELACIVADTRLQEGRCGEPVEACA